MNSNIILECRQQDTPNVVANGVYETYLANEVIINDGDILLMKNAMIDTKKEGNIIIEDDLILNINYGVYMTDWIEDVTNKKEYIDINGGNLFNYDPAIANIYKFGAVYKGQNFIPYYFKSTTGVDYQQVNSVTYKALGQVFGEQSPDMPVTYQYTDALTNQPVVVHSTIPASEPNVVYTDVLGFLIVKDTFSILSPSMRDMETDFFWKYISEDVTDVASDGVYSPYVFTKTFTLPAGVYSPNNLSLLMSKLMSENNINETPSTISNNSFVKYVSQFLPGAPFPNGAPGNIGQDGTYFFSSDMTTRFRFETGSPNYTFGATQTALEFDPDSNLFSFQYLHSPIFDLTTGSNISVRIANLGVITGFQSDNVTPIIANNYLKTTDNGGIFITGLRANLASNGVPFDFWKGVLGFDLSQITVKPRKPVIEPSTGSYFGLTGSFYSYFLNPGVNITSGYSGVDASVIKKIGATNWYTLSSVGIPAPSSGSSMYSQQPAIFSTIDETTPLTAYIAYNELLDSFSHYVIDADLKFIGNYIGRDKYNNIQGTVSKYYQTANYIVSDGDGAIQYTHRGMPLILKSIKINILKSNKTVDINLGPDNTIIFQLIKSTKPSS